MIPDVNHDFTAKEAELILLLQPSTHTHTVRNAWVSVWGGVCVGLCVQVSDNVVIERLAGG